MNLFSGDVFSVGRPVSSRGLSVDNYMKEMGAGKDFSDFSPEEFVNEPVLPGANETEDYRNALNRYNQFGMAMAARGHNVNRLDPSNPESRKIAEHASQLMSKVEQSANAARMKTELTKQYTKERLKKGIVGGIAVGEQGASMADMDRLQNMSPFVDSLRDTVDDVNSSFVKSYDSKVERDDANIEIEDRRSKMSEMYQMGIDMGYPPEQVKAFVEAAKTSIGSATFNQDAASRLDIKRGEARAKNYKNYQTGKAALNKQNGGKNDNISNWADKFISLHKGGEYDRNASVPKGTFLDDDRIQGLEPHPLEDDFFKNKRIGNKTIDTVKWGENGPELILIDNNDLYAGKMPLNLTTMKQMLSVTEYRKFYNYLNNNGYITPGGNFRNKEVNEVVSPTDASSTNHLPPIVNKEDSKKASSFDSNGKYKYLRN